MIEALLLGFAVLAVPVVLLAVVTVARVGRLRRREVARREARGAVLEGGGSHLRRLD